MTFIMYVHYTEKVVDVFPGCWQKQDEAHYSKWAAWEVLTGNVVSAYCVDHDCPHNIHYKPGNYIRKEDR